MPYFESKSLSPNELYAVTAYILNLNGLVGENEVMDKTTLPKVQMPNLPTLYGAMLAGVACVIMGAGIPREIPGALDLLAQPDRHR